MPPPRTQRAAVLGSPIAPLALAGAAPRRLPALGLAAGTTRRSSATRPGCPACWTRSAPDWAGLSLTMPLKRAVLPLLDPAEPLAAEVGGANTVIFADGGPPRLQHRRARHDHRAGRGRRHAPPARALVLGAGATACSALGRAPRLWRRPRRPSPSGTRPPRASCWPSAGRLGITVRLVPFGAGAWRARRWHLLISTVPPERPTSTQNGSRAGTLAPAAVLDVVYHPWPTRLAAAAAAAGAAVSSGFELLLHQAARQVELMTGRTPRWRRCAGGPGRAGPPHRVGLAPFRAYRRQRGRAGRCGNTSGGHMR